MTPGSGAVRGARMPTLRVGTATLFGAILVFAAVLSIAFMHYRGQTLARGPDQADILLSFFHEASHAIEEEGLLAAMYTPGVRAGESHWSNPNYHPLYPGYLNWIGGDRTVYDTLDRLNLVIFLHLSLLGAGAFCLARALGVQWLPALAVGLAIPWYPAVRSAAAWPHIIAGMAWLPWIFAFQAWLLERASARRGAWGCVGGLAACAVLLVYAQPAQNLVFAASGSAMLWLLIAAQAAARRDRQSLRTLARCIGWLALAAIVVLAATGGYLVEIVRFHERAIRWLGEYGGHVIGSAPIPVGALRMHALPVEDARLLFAFEYRKGIGNLYLGAMLLVAATGVFARSMPCSPRTYFSRALLACALLATLSCFAFMAPLLHTMPLIGKVRELTWWSCLAVVLLLPLAAAGLQSLSQRDRPVVTKDGWTLTAACICALALAATLRTDTSYRVEALAALLAGSAALLWLLRYRGKNSRHVLGIACLLLLACAAWAPFRHNIEFAREDATLFLPDRIQARADAVRLRALLPDEDSYRIVLHGALPNAQLLTHSYAAMGLRSIHGGIGPVDHAKHLLLSSPGAAVSALYGVKYTVLPATLSDGSDLLLRRGLALRTQPAAMPRLFFIGGGLSVVDDPVATLRSLSDPSPVRALMAQRDVPAGLDVAAFAAGEPQLVQPILSENRRTRLRAMLVSDRPGMLILNEDPAGRWRARIDGQAVQALRINGFQSAFAIPAAGRHAIEIERPGRISGAMR